MTPRFPLGRTVATPGALALGIDLAVHFIKVREETTAHASDVKYATQGP